MQLLNCLWILFVGSAVATTAVLSPPVQQVDDAFEPKMQELLEKGGDAFVMFHAGWCGACKYYKATYQEFAEWMSSNNKNSLILAVDNDAAPSICFCFVGLLIELVELASRFQVTYLPAVYHIRDGKVRNVSNARMELENYVAHSKWNEVNPVNEHMAPFSLLGTVLAFVGAAGSQILTLVEAAAKRLNIDQNWILGVMVFAVFAGFYILFQLNLPPKPTPSAASQKAKKEN